MIDLILDTMEAIVGLLCVIVSLAVYLLIVLTFPLWLIPYLLIKKR